MHDNQEMKKRNHEDTLCNKEDKMRTKSTHCAMKIVYSIGNAEIKIELI